MKSLNIYRIFGASLLFCGLVHAAPGDKTDTGGGIGGTGHEFNYPMTTMSSDERSNCSHDQIVGTVTQIKTKSLKLNQNQPLCMGEVIRTAEDDYLAIQLTDGPLITLLGKAELILPIQTNSSSDKPSTSIVLKTGKMRIQTKSLILPTQISVTTPIAVVNFSDADLEIASTPTKASERNSKPELSVRSYKGEAQLSNINEVLDIPKGYVGTAKNIEGQFFLRLEKDEGKLGPRIPTMGE